MEIHNNIQYRMRTDKGIKRKIIELSEKSNKDNLKEVALVSNFNYNSLDISMINGSEEDVVIYDVEIHILTLSLKEYESFISNPEFSDENIQNISLKRIKKKIIKESFWYSAFKGKNEVENILIGFSSCHKSRNYFKFEIEKDLINVYAVYDFINYKIMGKETINLDSVCFYYDYKYYKVFNKYVDKLIESNDISVSKKFFCEKTIESTFLFDENKTDYVLMDKKKPLTISIDGKTFYLLDIRQEKVKQSILNWCSEIQNNDNVVVKLNYIKDYILKVSEENLFNVYLELSNLFMLINQSLNNIVFSFDDCPEGLAVGYLDIINDEINLNDSKKTIKPFIKNENRDDMNMNFVIKTLIQNNVFYHNTKYIIKNNLLNKMMQFINLNNNASEIYNKELIELYNDINKEKYPGLYWKRYNVFSIWRQGKENIYIGIFNNTDTEQSFYLDISLYSDYDIPNGTAIDVLSKQQYLIDNNKIYIKKLFPNECKIIKKSIRA